MSRRHVPPTACSTCPYRRDTPSGVWAPIEYEKLRIYDLEPWEDADSMRAFDCHQSNVTGNPTICRGWLDTHQDSVGVRVACMRGLIDVADVPLTRDPIYYDSGNEAADAGLADVEAPSAKAKKALNRLFGRGGFLSRDEA